MNNITPCDCHLHTNNSFDSETPAEQQVNRARELGIATIALTDHCDILEWSDANIARSNAQAIELNAPDARDALDVLSKLGGFDLAGMVGLYLGGALHRVPVVADGFISMASALLAMHMAPVSACAILASHSSAEPAVHYVAEELARRSADPVAGLLQADVAFAPVIQAGMRLGEGTGAVLLVPLLDSTLSIYNGSTFADIEIEAYDPSLVK